jgi:hypothetical protein
VRAAAFRACHGVSNTGGWRSINLKRWKLFGEFAATIRLVADPNRYAASGLLINFLVRERGLAAEGVWRFTIGLSSRLDAEPGFRVAVNRLIRI